MPGYRLFLLDRDGHITERIDIETDDEAEALRVADETAHDFEMELWQLTRVVKKYPAKFCKSATG